jgi:hypothetical protein
MKLPIKVVPKGKRSVMIPLGVGLIYAEEGGGLVLKTEVTWKKISGFVINTNKGCIWIKFRRFSPYDWSV